jgi:hypothetical protein
VRFPGFRRGLYKEPEVKEDLPNGCDWLYRMGGKAIWQPVKVLPPWKDKICFANNKECYQKELDKNLDLTDCPSEF